MIQHKLKYANSSADKSDYCLNFDPFPGLNAICHFTDSKMWVSEYRFSGRNANLVRKFVGAERKIDHQKSYLQKCVVVGQGGISWDLGVVYFMRDGAMFFDRVKPVA